MIESERCHSREVPVEHRLVDRPTRLGEPIVHRTGMMPEIDGFAVLDALRSKPETANIPVIVATAKELTVDEKSRLQGQIQSLMLKGDFLNDEFLEEVRSLIR